MRTKSLQKIWIVHQYINDMTKAMTCCGNLIIVNEKQQIVHFTHDSVKEYLLSKVVQKSLNKYYIDLKLADAEADAICVIYFNFFMFNKQLTFTISRNINIINITSTVVKNNLSFEKFVNKIAFNVLKRRNKFTISINRVLKKVIDDIENYRQHTIFERYFFQSYAKHFWLKHIKQKFDFDSKKLLRLWRNLIKKINWRDNLDNVSWKFENWKKRASFVVQWIIKQNHCLLAQKLIEFDIKFARYNISIFIENVAFENYKVLLKIILNSENISQTMLNSTFQIAAENDHFDVLKKLIQTKIDVNAAVAADNNKIAFLVATEDDHLDVMKKLRVANSK